MTKKLRFTPQKLRPSSVSVTTQNHSAGTRTADRVKLGRTTSPPRSRVVCGTVMIATLQVTPLGILVRNHRQQIPGEVVLRIYLLLGSIQSVSLQRQERHTFSRNAFSSIPCAGLASPSHVHACHNMAARFTRCCGLDWQACVHREPCNADDSARDGCVKVISHHLSSRIDLLSSTAALPVLRRRRRRPGVQQ